MRIKLSSQDICCIAKNVLPGRGISAVELDGGCIKFCGEKSGARWKWPILLCEAPDKKYIGFQILYPTFPNLLVDLWCSVFSEKNDPARLQERALTNLEQFAEKFELGIVKDETLWIYSDIFARYGFNELGKVEVVVNDDSIVIQSC